MALSDTNRGPVVPVGIMKELDSGVEDNSLSGCPPQTRHVHDTWTAAHRADDREALGQSAADTLMEEQQRSSRFDTPAWPSCEALLM